ncbi:AraC family transcriptional regulator [Phenylobacterium sp.]|jgi:AraC-like DNA-binding protein|uniref:AraC family transcriptional regulator n=1 Tax=Phenylobacterium sp. TaxID=1871053 RepID=UPI002F3E6532
MNNAALASQYTEILLETARQNGLDGNALFGDEPVFATRGRKPAWSNYQLGVMQVNLKYTMNDDFWGMLGDARVPLGTFRYACEICILSRTLGEALERVYRLYGLVSDGVKYHLDVDDGLASITMELPGRATQRNDFLFEWWLWLWHYVSQWFVGAEIQLVRVDFPHQPIGERRHYEAVFGPNCHFESDVARITFDKAMLDRRIVRNLADVDRMLARKSVSLSTPEIERSCKTIVKAALTAHLEQTNTMPTLEQLALEQGVCGQTLRRRLQGEGMSYRALKAQVRGEVARRCLTRQGATMSEVASRAGFAEPNGLTRAIRSWTGLSVTEFRRAVAEQT